MDANEIDTQAYHDDTQAELNALRAQVAELEDAKTPRPAADYHEDFGTVLWWVLPVCEPPYVGSPLDCDWEEGYYTHWTPIITPNHKPSRMRLSMLTTTRPRENR